MRLGLGYGYMRLARKTSARDALTDEPVAGAEEYDGDSTIQGPGPALDLSFGGTVGNALVLCGTLYAQSTASKTLEREAGADIELGGGLALLLFGFGMHWYPVPTSGFNIGGMLGLGLAGGDTASSSSFTTVGGFGGAVSVDVGYDFWIAEQWSIGATLRATGGSFHGQSSGNLPGGDVVEGREDDVLTGFTLIASVLRH
jgi:hypothetical protein